MPKYLSDKKEEVRLGFIESLSFFFFFYVLGEWKKVYMRSVDGEEYDTLKRSSFFLELFCICWEKKGILFLKKGFFFWKGKGYIQDFELRKLLIYKRGSQKGPDSKENWDKSWEQMAEGGISEWGEGFWVEDTEVVGLFVLLNNISIG